MDSYIDDYVNALDKEIELGALALRKEKYIHSIYIGGGTPSVLKAEHFERFLDSIKTHCHLTDDIEITTEANPYKLTQSYLHDLYSLGIHRLSMGMQSGIETELEMLGRLHRTDDAERSMHFARKAGYKNINLDLIFGIPNQTIETLQQSLEKALDLAPEHLSLYALKVEQGTPLERMIINGDIPEPDEDLSAEMYTWVMQELTRKGFEQYEISNWTRQNALRSRHNLQYWRNGYYLGFGAGAHSHYDKKRWANVNAIPAYIQRLNAAGAWQNKKPPAADEITELTDSDVIQETMMMGLRLVEEGIAEDDFKKRFNLDLREVYPREIDQLFEDGLLEYFVHKGRDIIRLTPRGRMLGNQVFMQFIKA